MTPIILLPGLFIFLGILTQSIAGFGSALVAMPLLIQLLGVQQAATLFSLVVGTAEIGIILRYRRSFNVRAVARLTVASAVGIPIGVVGLAHVPEQFVLLGLGLLLVAYGSYALIGLHIPPLNNPRWGYGFGFASGVLSGAYNTGGPPLVIYGTGRRWTSTEFKSNIQTVFAFNTAIVILTRLGSGSITPEVCLLYVITIPFALVALGVGFAIERFINPAVFRRLVLVMLIVLGGKMVLFDSGIFG